MRRLRREESRVGVMELGCLSLHALCSAASEAWYTCEQSEESEYGQLVSRSSGEHEEGGQCEGQCQVESERGEGKHAGRRGHD
jgi:hypothetical protein